jgi:hypothetical protein
MTLFSASPTRWLALHHPAAAQAALRPWLLRPPPRYHCRSLSLSLPLPLPPPPPLLWTMASGQVLPLRILIPRSHIPAQHNSFTLLHVLPPSVSPCRWRAAAADVVLGRWRCVSSDFALLRVICSLLVLTMLDLN